MASAKKQTYHHGDLHAALVSAGLALLEERQNDDIGLREVARAVGVSATAVYRHFPDKAALLQALAAEGLARLAASQKAAFEGAGGGKPGFQATGRAYVRFALDNPALFRLVFSNAPGLAEGADTPDAFRMLSDNARFEAPEGADEATVRQIALSRWSLAHGVAVLMLDNMLPRDEALLEALV